MEACVSRIQGFIENAISINGTVTGPARKQREFLFHVSCACMIAIAAVAAISAKTSFSLAVLSMLCVEMLFFMCFCGILAGKVIPPLTIQFVGYGSTFSLFFADICVRGVGRKAWPTFLITTNFLLVMRVRGTAVLVTIIIGYLCLCALEEVFRFGMFDIPLAWEAEIRKEHMQNAMDCETLPCPLFPQEALTDGAISIIVTVLVWKVTSMFSNQLIEQNRFLDETILAVEAIASNLAGYDVDQAEQILKAHESRLPSTLSDALWGLQQNLRVYKPYLPNSCFCGEEEENEEEDPTRDNTPLPDTAKTDPTQTPHLDIPEVKHARRGPAGLALVVNIEEKPPPILMSPKVSLAAMKPQNLVMSWGKVTLVTVNVKDTLMHIEDNLQRFGDSFGDLLEQVIHNVHTQRGIADIFLADKILCSFGASKNCGTHACAAVHAMKQLLETLLFATETKIGINVGIATGKVVRGDMGCAGMRRFNIIGCLTANVATLERIARDLDVDVLCSQATWSDAELLHPMKLVPRKFSLMASTKAGVIEELAAAVVLAEGIEESRTSEDQEWLYEISFSAKRWEDYNRAVTLFMAGADVASAAKIAGDKEDLFREAILRFSESETVYDAVYELEGGREGVTALRPFS